MCHKCCSSSKHKCYGSAKHKCCGSSKHRYAPRSPIIGKLNFTGVVRDTDPDGTILSVVTDAKTYAGYTLTDISIFMSDNTAIYNASTSGGYTNVSAYVISFKVNILSTTYHIPVATATPSLILNGTGNAIVNNILSTEITCADNCATFVYAVVIYGADQKASNDLLEVLFTPIPNPLDPTTTITSGINFVLNYSC